MVRPSYFPLGAALALLLTSLAGTGVAQEKKEKKVKDQAEYDLFQSINKEQDLTKKVQLLNTWKEKYPESDFKEDRQLIYIQTYQGLQQGDNMLTAAKDLLAMDPKSVPALYYITLLTVSLNNTAPDRLDLGEKAARGLIASLDDTFKPEKKPANVTEDQWKNERNKLEAEGRKCLAFVHTGRKELDKAEQEYTSILKMIPSNGQVAYQLASNLVAQRNPDKQMSAFYHFARAAYLTGENALPAATAKQVQAYLDKIYRQFHGSDEGLKDMIAEAAKGGAFPPEGWKVKSATELAAEEEEKLRQSDPQKALWLAVKKELVGPNGPAYFESNVKGTGLPKLKGKVVSVKPATRPKEIVLALATEAQAEITLKVSEAMAGTAAAGTQIEFEEAVPTEFASEPFMLTAEIDKEKISGWPVAKAPAARKGAAKKGSTKK